ncbi:MAG: trehalase family glycosidase [Phycisphaeraceae bacterium]|nr:trehalase family glycosidase [Phycisphaeraceae bacterium]
MQEATLFSLDEVPFSRYGSYFSLSVNSWGPLDNGLYLHVHYGNGPCAFRIDPVRSGERLDYRVVARPESLRLLTEDGGEVEFLIEVRGSSGTVRVRGENVQLQLAMPPERWTWAYQLPAGWAFNYSTHQVQLGLEALRGEVEVDAPWEKGRGFCFETTHAEVTLTPDESGQFEVAIDDFVTRWVPVERPAFETVREQAAEEYARWTEGLPAVDDEFVDARDLAAYVNASAVVNPAGSVTRPTMYMSKMGMCNVYNWDNVFNAMAHCRHRPDLAWDQLLVMADHQDEHGKSPSSLNRSGTRMTVTNSPVHGWGLRYMREANPDLLTPERAEEAYDYLARWTQWICQVRTWPGDRLPFHHHGFDSGWDNSSIFDRGVPVVTPAYAAYTILQMETLADLARDLGREAQSDDWQSRRDAMLDALVEDLWNGDRFIGIVRPSGEEVVCESLLICMPIVLGERLPEDVQTSLVARIRDHLTEHGLATEKLDSPNYVEGGYWRGPIWAPSTMLVTSGLLDIGEEELARTIMRSFCKMCAANGFYENFDPKTGKGYYDSAYTWTSSVFLMFANWLHEHVG